MGFFPKVFLHGVEGMTYYCLPGGKRCSSVLSTGASSLQQSGQGSTECTFSKLADDSKMEENTDQLKGRKGNRGIQMCWINALRLII